MKIKHLLFLLLLPLAVMTTWTAKAQNDLLFIEDFENGTSLPAGWTTEGGGLWLIGVGDDGGTTPGAGHGAQNIYYRSTYSASANVKLITPVIDLSNATNAELSFMHLMRRRWWDNGLDQMSVYYRSTQNDYWTLLRAYTDEIPDWTTDCIFLPNLSSTYQICFEVSYRVGLGTAIDYVRINEVSCPTLYNFSVYASDTIAEMSWDCTSNSGNYTVRYRAASAEWLTLTTSNTHVTITGLTPETDYEAQVKIDCDDVLWSDIIPFTTSPTVTHIPYVTTFDTIDGWQFINGDRINHWGYNESAIRIMDDSGTWSYTIDQAATVYAAKAFYFDAGVYNFTYTWMVGGYESADHMRVFLVPDRIKLKATAEAPTYFHYGAPSGWIAIDGGVPLSEGGRIEKHEVQVPTAGIYKVVFGWTNIERGGVLRVPAAVIDLSITPVSCPAPVNLHSTDVSYTSATFDWTELGDATAWQICLNNDMTNLIEVLEKPYTLTGLNTETEYTVLLRANCGDEFSKWVEDPVSITTHGYPKPTNLQCTDITDNTITFSWTENGGADSWQICLNDDESQLYDADSNPFTLTDVPEYTAFTAKVRVNGTWGSSQWSDGIVICPNPTGLQYEPATTTTANLVWTENGEATSWLICLNDDETNLIVADSNPFMLTGLTENATYSVKVCAKRGGQRSVWSEALSFVASDRTIIGSGNEYNNHLPLHLYYKYSISQQIYTAEELGLTGDIVSIDYYCRFRGSVSPDDWHNWAGRQLDIYMVHTDKSRFINDATAKKDWIPVTTEDLVFSGTVQLTVGDWTTIILDTPFAYNGQQNVAILVYDHTGIDQTGHYAFSSINAYHQTLYLYSDKDYIIYDPTTINSEHSPFGTAIEDEKTQIRVMKDASSPNQLPVPTNLLCTEVGINTATLSWNDGGGATSWQVYIQGKSNNILAADENHLTMTNLKPGTDYIAKVRACYGNELSDWSEETSFTTMHQPIPPYSTDFESDCDWTFINGDLTNAWVWGEAAHNGEGTHGLYISNDGGETNAYTNTDTAMVYVAKTFHLESGEYCFSYDWLANGEEGSDYMRVALVPDSKTLVAGMELPYGWIALDEGNPLYGATEWQTKSVMATVPYTEDWKMVFVWSNNNSGGDNPPAAVDNVSINPVCQTPTDLQCTAVTGVTATLSWTENGDATAWQICLNGDESNLIDADSNPFIITGLDENTAYTAKVRATSGIPSGWSDEVSFQTLLLTLFIEDFEDITALPDGWTTEGPGTWIVGVGDYNSTTGAGHGQQNALIKHSSNGKVTKLITPEIDLSTVNDAELSFMHVMRNWSNDLDELRVYYRTAPAEEWMLLAEYTDETPAWTTERLTLSDFSGTYQIAFEMTDKYGYGVGVDYVRILAISCSIPYDVAVGDVTATTAEMSWNIASDAENYTVRFAVVPDGGWQTATTDSTSITLTGLTPATTYKAQVKSGCDETLWSDVVMFTTTQIPTSIPYSTDFESDCDWTLINGDLTNAWVWGEAAHNGEGTHGLYISNDGGTTNAYDNLASTMVYAAKTFAFEAGTYNISYDWIAKGENTYDFLRVALVPTSVTLEASTVLPTGFNYNTLPDGWIALDGGSKLNQTTEWQTASNDILLSDAGIYQLVFVWRNDANIGNNPPAAIDNVSIDIATCLAPVNLAVDHVTSTTTELVWNSYIDLDGYTARYKPTQSIVLREGFENGLGDWTLRDCHNNTGISSEGYYSGQNAFCFYFSTIPAQYLISPELSGIAEGTSLEFYYRNKHNSYPETFYIGFSSTDDATDSFTFGDVITASDTQWHLYSETVPAGTKYICWKYTSYDKYYLFIDDIVVGSNITDSEWQTATTGTNSITLTGLTPSTTYEAYVYPDCDPDKVSETVFFVTEEVASTVTQTLTLSEGWNWVSLYVEGDPIDLLQTLESALGENATQISSAELFTENDEGDWWGDLDEEGLTNEQMYMILVETPCTIEVEGITANPASHPITINPGWNWIGFPCDHEMTIEEALGGFDAEDGDVFANSENFTEFDGEWFGDVETLLPGQGFMYFSNSDEPKTLIIGSSKGIILKR